MPTRAWTRQEIIDETIRQANAAGTDPAIVLAVFEKESGFDERAVGDGGNSFGLRQLNRFGQLYGQSQEWAFDPRNAIPNAVQALANATTAAQATRVQNPAQPSKYASELAPLVAKWRSALTGRGSGSGGGKIVEVIGPLDGPSADHMDHVHVSIEGGPGDPTLAWIASRAAAHGLRESSGARTPAENRAAGGAAGSHHLTTNTRYEARDYAGSMDAMKAFNAEMRKARGTSGGSVSAPASDAANGDLQTVGLGIPGIDLPDRGDVLRVLFVVLLFVLGLALFAFGVISTFKDTAMGFTPVGAAKGAAK